MMTIQQLIRNDISIIIEIVDSLAASVESNPVVKSNVTAEQKDLIENLADAIANYRIVMTNPLQVERKPILEII